MINFNEWIVLLFVSILISIMFGLGTCVLHMTLLPVIGWLIGV